MTRRLLRRAPLSADGVADVWLQAHAHRGPVVLVVRDAQCALIVGVFSTTQAHALEVPFEVETSQDVDPSFVELRAAAGSAA